MVFLFGAIFIVWLAQTIGLVPGVLFKIPILKSRSFVSLRMTQRVSIIFAAKNEAPQVRTALASMLAQDYPDFEVIAVNDRSDDETSSILNSFDDPRLKVIDIRNLPEDWLGKTHGLFTAYQQSSGEWLLFTDADVHFSPDALQAAAAFIQENHADHLVIFPKLVTKNWIEEIFTGAFFMAFYRRFKPWTVSDPKSKNFVGVGAFNLVRRSFYEKAGTHEKLRLDVIDDMHLGRNLKEAGVKQFAVYGPELVSVQWIRGWQGVLKSLEKNAFAGFGYSWPLVALATMAGVCLDVLPFLGIFFTGPVFIFSVLTLFCIFACYTACSRVHANALFSFPTHAIGTLLMLAVIWRSVFQILRKGGVTWRSTFYPLSRLRAYSKN